jgi:hypothetical protein
LELSFNPVESRTPALTSEMVKDADIVGDGVNVAATSDLRRAASLRTSDGDGPQSRFETPHSAVLHIHDGPDLLRGARRQGRLGRSWQATIASSA